MDVGVSLSVARPASPAHDGASYGLLTLVPPVRTARAAVRRDLIFLIDVSGSMSGEPLDQVKRIAGAMIDTLGDEDRVELIAFGSAPVRFAKEPLAATRDGKRAAIQWLRALRASGATEMTRAVIEALAPLRPSSQRQVVLMTDGYIGFERELVREVLERLPAGARLHTVGVGSAINRTLTQWRRARAGAWRSSPASARIRSASRSGSSRAPRGPW
ncbi:MAG: VWA domain-containing protein [Sandaracinaceae bacterium]|nr:VWA domain-containing protein [Sandaracinaceae bacterium]